MNILFLGDIVGQSGCLSIKKNLNEIVKKNNINFVVANGENAADQGVGITENITNEILSCGVDVITTGNHVWDQKETLEHIKKEKRLLRPFNLGSDLPGTGFNIYNSKSNLKVGVLNIIGNVFMKKSNDVFLFAEEFTKKYKLKIDFDFLIVDFHGETTSEKMAMGHFFDGKATLFIGTHTHVPTNDARILSNGTAYQTDAGMCGDYNSVIGMDKDNSLNRFFKKESKKHFPSNGTASISGVIVCADLKTGLASKIEPLIYGGSLK